MTPLIIWRFSDGKAGHDNQSRGLIEALHRWRPVKAITLKPLSTAKILSGLVFRQMPEDWRTLPNPDLLVGAGHRTHLSLLVGRQRRGGQAVVLMRPTLPLSCFDLCLIPQHDSPPARHNVLTTRGALNRIQPSSALESAYGLILIGGPSAHFGWDNAALYHQLQTILRATLETRWTLTTSRRTPDDFLAGLSIESKRLTVVPVAVTGPDWLPEQLARAGQVWVTADSVSMVYEAVTAGAKVGVLNVPMQRPNRISRGLNALAAQGWVTAFDTWLHTAQLSRPSEIFNEAERCAHEIVNRWFV